MTEAMRETVTDWRDRAACLGIANSDIFFPIGRDPQAAEDAKDVCRRCPVVRDCLTFALTHEVSGVWGGTSDGDRDDLRARHGIVAKPIPTAVRIADTLSDEIAIADRGGLRPRRSPNSWASRPVPCDVTVQPTDPVCPSEPNPAT